MCRCTEPASAMQYAQLCTRAIVRWSLRTYFRGAHSDTGHVWIRQAFLQYCLSIEEPTHYFSYLPSNLRPHLLYRVVCTTFRNIFCNVFRQLFWIFVSYAAETGRVSCSRFHALGFMLQCACASDRGHAERRETSSCSDRAPPPACRVRMPAIRFE